jgi:hypothetical protein
MKKPPVTKLILGVFVLITVFSAGVYAADGIERIEAVLRPDYQITLDKQAVSLDQKPLIYEDRTYLPLSMIAKLLGAQVGWDVTTKTISITSPPSPQPVEPSPAQTGQSPANTDSGQAYSGNSSGDVILSGEIKLKSLIAYNAIYKNNEYPVLSNSDQNTTYFRVKDVLKMGIPLGGLKVYKDTYTKELYIATSELEGRWDEIPGFNMYNQPIVNGESDPDIIKHLSSINLGYTQFGSESNKLICLSIDKLPNEANTYLYLCQYMNTDLYGYEVTIKYNSSSKSWYTSSTSNIKYTETDEN